MAFDTFVFISANIAGILLAIIACDYLITRYRRRKAKKAEEAE
jgi:uncharacterized integral membrane protein